MATTSSNVNMFQKVLDKDSEMKSSYVQTENDSDSDSDEDACKIMLPTRSKKKHTDTSQELLFQLIRQNQELSKTQKNLYKLQAEIDKEEVTNRYIKLDLNNTQVSLVEANEKIKTCKKELKSVYIENYMLRGFVILYITFRIYCFLNEL